VTDARLRTVGLFAGIGGIELGLEAAGCETKLLSEVDDAAAAVLDERFPGVPLTPDIRDLHALPPCDVVTAGFPCQDLSQAGRTAGIGGTQSGLVAHVFRLLDGAAAPPSWLLLENVPFMLQLERGEAMDHLVRELTIRGWSWAYRIVDTRAFGLPQRRQRVILLASRTRDPRPVLFAEEYEPEEFELLDDSLCGFYWTEGLRGLGWAVDSIPTLKGGSGVGIPSPPAIWDRAADEVFLPEIRDAERLQGFPVDWTAPAAAWGRRGSARWRLVGNAVSVPVAEWIGSELLREGAQPCPPREWESISRPRARHGSWGSAAWGSAAGSFELTISKWPLHEPTKRLRDFLAFDRTPLSWRATRGFLRRADEGNLRMNPDFISALEEHLARLTAVAA
jgi:DNA (cytosine-5)-methyltransferase 1